MPNRLIMSDLVFSVSDFVAVFNQTIEYAYPLVSVQGELANFRVSKGRWVYFDLKDEYASLKFFGTVYQLPGPLEDGLMVLVRGQPRLHPQYGFSVNIQSIQTQGEGSLRRAAALLEAKLRAEGLFDPTRKRTLPYPPRRVGLITSGESAAYRDFVKILDQRWGGVEVLLADVQVQGEAAPGQLVAALEFFNTHEQPVDVLVITRGGGSAEDLAAFSHEQVTRGIAGSRIPTMVAIGHEVDVSLAELAADQRASTPSNAAELLVPDRQRELIRLGELRDALGHQLQRSVGEVRMHLAQQTAHLTDIMKQFLQERYAELRLRHQVLEALSPAAALGRGYAIIRSETKPVTSVRQLQTGQTVGLRLHDGQADAVVTNIHKV